MMVGPHVQLYIYGYKRTEQLWFKPNYGSSFSRNVHSRVQELGPFSERQDFLEQNWNLARYAVPGITKSTLGYYNAICFTGSGICVALVRSSP